LKKNGLRIATTTFRGISATVGYNCGSKLQVIRDWG
jgi:hypothetical protein